MVCYRVKDTERLKLSHMRIWEPDSALCERVDLSQIDWALVPGLAFDRENYRLGYGEGWYDRLLGQAKDLHSIGIGFREQLASDLLPRDSWDVPLQELLLN